MPGGGVADLSVRDSPFKGATGGMTYRSGANRSQLIAWSRAQTMARRDATNTTVWTFEAVPEGTMLTAVLEVQFKGVLKLLQPIAEQQGRTALREWMRAFAHHVEAE